LLIGLLALPWASLADEATRTGLQSDVAFSDYADLARGVELARRSLSPLNALRLRASTPAGQTIDLAHETFTLYVPAAVPPQGYGLLVFVSPWPGAAVPARWASILDRHDLIFVTAARAGNDANTFERREPLALLAAHNVMARYPVDRTRVFVGGFSGGSRVAERLALAYPDLFRGALLDAGSDPIGDAVPLPPADLFRQFQEGSRLVYLTGAHDDFHGAEDRRSQRSMTNWCVFGIAEETMPWSGHDEADPASLDRALDDLARPVPSDPAKLEACRAHIAADMAARMREAEALRAGGARDRAWTQLVQIDAHFGGLAAAAVLDLAARLTASP
jgi:pimeloyl-ACP methyl ester carboxylesterase